MATELMKMFQRRVKMIKIYYISAKWCGPCKMFKPIVEKFAQEHPEVEVIYEDIDDCDEKQKQFKVNAVPTMIFFKDDKETARVSGVQSKKKLEQLLDEASI